MENDPTLYSNLTSDEEIAIAVYMDNNDRGLVEKICFDGDMSDDFRRFCVNLNSGKIKRSPRKKPSADLRAIEIHNHFYKQIREGRTWDMAFQITGDKFFKSRDTVNDALKKINKLISDVIEDPETWR
jgi:hypothetical protein